MYVWRRTPGVVAVGRANRMAEVLNRTHPSGIFCLHVLPLADGSVIEPGVIEVVRDALNSLSAPMRGLVWALEGSSHGSTLARTAVSSIMLAADPLCPTTIETTVKEAAYWLALRTCLQASDLELGARNLLSLVRVGSSAA